MAQPVTLYIKSGCTQCRRVQDLLGQQGAALTVRDFFKHPLNEGELRRLLGGRSAAEAFSWRSPSVKAMALDVEAVRTSEDEMVRLMLQEPRLIRRPILVAGETAVFGAAAKDVAAAATPA